VHFSADPTVRAPRVGVIGGKQVGPAVVRKRVSRRLREALRFLILDLPEGSRLVVRALPSADGAPVRELAEQLKSALAKLTSRREF
jgi:ribonuclease P protein component